MHKKLFCWLKTKGRCFSATEVKLVREKLRVCIEIHSPRKKPTFSEPTTGFPAKWRRGEEQAQKFHTDDVLIPGFK